MFKITIERARFTMDAHGARRCDVERLLVMGVQPNNGIVTVVTTQTPGMGDAIDHFEFADDAADPVITVARAFARLLEERGEAPAPRPHRPA